jgi:hypothetical protein
MSIFVLFPLSATCFDRFDRHQLVRIHVVALLNCSNVDPYNYIYVYNYMLVYYKY